MRQEQDELGRFKSQYSNLGDTVRMRVPKSCQKLIRELLTELDSVPDHLDPTDILSEIVQGLSDNIK